VLFDHHVFDAITRGEITLTFRNWKRPHARTGSRQRLNRRGVIEIRSVAQVDASAISPADARRAGFESIQELRARLVQRAPLPMSGLVYRIEFLFVPEVDARDALAANGALSDADASAIAAKLDRMDARSAGPWTRKTLRLIADNPHVLSTTLASIAGRERLLFKADVRKLKALGLTISHEVGYEISPRGRAFLARESSRSRCR
jgi:hypothetical protein